MSAKEQRNISTDAPKNQDKHVLSTQRNVRLQLAQAFNRLTIKPDQRHLIPNLVDALLPMAGKTNISLPARYKRVGGVTIRKELQKLVRLIAALHAHLDSLHEPSIVALADCHLLLPTFMVELKRAAKAANVSTLASDAILREAPKNNGKGRPQNRVANRIASILAEKYKSLTLKTPTITVDVNDNSARGPYLQLVTDVFKALGVKASAEAAAHFAISRIRQCK